MGKETIHDFLIEPACNAGFWLADDQKIAIGIYDYSVTIFIVGQDLIVCSCEEALVHLQQFSEQSGSTWYF